MMKHLSLTIALITSFSLTINAQTKKTTVKKTSPVSTTITEASLLRGKTVYGQYCLSCHQADGGGVPGLNPPLIKTEYVLGAKDRLIGIVLKGFNQEVEIDGEIYSNAMPPLNFLTDQQVADVLTYVRNNFQNKASAVTSTEVKSARAKK